MEASTVFIGGVIALHRAPGLVSRSEIIGIALIYLCLATAMTAMRQLESQQDQGADWLLWLTLLLCVVGNHEHTRAAIGGLLVWLLFSATVIGVVRTGSRRLAASTGAAIHQQTSIAFIGNSQSALNMLRQLQARPTLAYNVIGFFDDRAGRPGPLSGVLPCLGTIGDLVSYIHDKELDEVYMALPWSAGERIVELLGRLRFLPLTVKLVPDHIPPALPSRADDVFQGIVMPTLMAPPFSAAGAIMKRTIDIVGVCLLLVPLLPLFSVVAILIKLDSKGPVLFRQQRSGQYGRQFSIYKFRSLHVAQSDAAAERLVIAGDRRVTRVGRYLRKYSIDELPQVFNVLFGEMSLVGPRPHAPRAKADGRIYAELIPEYMLRYRVKPGMTGWAQVNGWRGNTDTEEQLRKRVEFDFQYIGRWSLRRDFEILIRTVPSMLLPPEENV